MKKLFTFFAALGLALTTQAANIAVSGLQYCDAYYWTYEDEESGSSIALYDFDLYVDYDSDTEILTYPEVYVQVPANSKTALNGTYEVWYAGYWKSAKDSVESDEYATDAVGTITFKNVDSEGNYQVSLSFTATDGNTYTVNDTIEVWAFDYDNDYADITLNESGSAPAGDAIYQIDFTTDITGWTIDDKDLSGLTYVWKQDDRYGMKASAYANKQAYAAESWLISSAIDLTNAVAPSLVISQALNKGTAENLAVKVSADNGATWTDLTINMPAGNSWDFQEDQASLAAFAGKTIQIAFAYKSTTSVCPTWEIGSVLVQDGGAAALQQTEQDSKATKMLRNGQLYIQRGEKLFNVLGAMAE